MKHVCKYCKKEFELNEHEEELLDYHNDVIDELDCDGDDNISPYRLDISVNPTIHYGVGEFEEEQSIISELKSDMCVDCKNELIATLKLSVYEWKKGKGVV